jgi:hypothetical protein
VECDDILIVVKNWAGCRKLNCYGGSVVKCYILFICWPVRLVNVLHGMQ